MSTPPDVPHLYDHMGLTCAECGSARFALLRSGKIECHGCQQRLPAYWVDTSDPAPAAPLPDDHP